MSAAASAIAAIASSLMRAPVGLAGELMTMAFVRDVMASMKAFASSAKPSSAPAVHDDGRRLGELDLLDDASASRARA